MQHSTYCTIVSLSAFSIMLLLLLRFFSCSNTSLAASRLTRLPNQEERRVSTAQSDWKDAEAVPG